jgi:hypothetical protein
MSKRLYRTGCTAVAALVAGGLGAGASTASAKPVLMPTLQKEIQMQQQIWKQHTFAPQGALQPPAPPCPENGMLPSPLSSCGVPEAPATTLPYPGNMAYWGGHVQTSPHVYVVYWGWGEKGVPGRPAVHRREARGGHDDRDAQMRSRRRRPIHGQLGLPVRRHAMGG